jgi:hypothetical protein
MAQPIRRSKNMKRRFTLKALKAFSASLVLISAAEVVRVSASDQDVRVPDGQTVLLKALGKGVQIYECKAKAGDPGKFEWSFKAPEADLTNEDGKKIAKHYAGPTWEANDGSKVVGEVQKKADAPKPGAIPWLLLKAKKNEGTGTFEKVTYVQRVDTEGGVPPTAVCDRDHVTTEARVDYRANYYFYVPQR